MTVIGSATFELLGDASDFRASMGQALGDFQALGQRMQSVGNTLSRRVTLPLLAVGGASFKMAADAEEAANKFNVVMGRATDDVRARLQDMTDTIPLTRSEMERLASGIQDMLVPMGLARDQAANMSVDMVELAGDLASFNNVPTARALEAIQSALAGSSEPMRRFGVDTRVTRLQQIALEEGLIAAGEEMTNQSTALAVMSAIQRDSTDAMGDAARTADSASNQMRFLWREVKLLGEQIGGILMPVLTPMVRGLVSMLETVSGLPAPVQITIVAVAGLAAAAGPLILAVGTLLALAPALAAGIAGIGTALAVLLGPVGWVAAALGVAAFVWIKWGDDIKAVVRATVEAVQTWIVDRLGGIFERVTGMVQGVADSFRWLKDVVVGNSYIPEMVDGIAVEVERLDDVMVRPVMDATAQMARGFERLGGQAVDALADMATGGGTTMRQFVDRAIADIQRLIAKIIILRALSLAFPGSGFVASLAGGVAARASGGPVRRNHPYMVGERGPELFVPGSTGRIVSNESMGGGATFDFAGFPSATNPLAAARDDDWQQFLRASERHAHADGFDPGR